MNSVKEFERTEKLITSNRKARHEFEVIQTFEAGIVLQGTEVKSLRQGMCSVQDAYAAFQDKNFDELYLVNFHISPYEQGNRFNHEPRRARKLLLTHRELNKLRAASQEKGLTMIPLKLYFSGPYVKVEIGLVRAKRKYDKRESVKERETEREIQRKFRY